MALIVGLPPTAGKFDAMVTVVCRLTKTAHFIPTSQAATAEDLAHILIRDVIRLHGVSRTLVSDRDSRFSSDIWASMCKQLGIQRCMSTAYHPQSDCQSERTNQTIEQMLRCALLSNEEKWEHVLPMLEFADNSMANTSVRAAPFEFICGFLPPEPLCQQLGIPTASAAGILPFPGHVKLRRAKREPEYAQAYQKGYADKHRREVQFHQGQRVWLKATNLPLDQYCKALRRRFVGPFAIKRMVGLNAAEVELPASWLIHPVFHVALLRQAIDAPSHLTCQERGQQPYREEEYLIEGILDHREYKVGDQTFRDLYVLEQDGTKSWIPQEDLGNATKSLRNYFRGRRS
ncbi:transposon related [Cystoisospora suis]|uniref:Transposon related n=1 Tax=Cystoisospora suis TaxID=483139 RepID=A0A2C6KZM2_9APIC|nr:transposon related [Cystoisospora suis]